MLEQKPSVFMRLGRCRFEASNFVLSWTIMCASQNLNLEPWETCPVPRVSTLHERNVNLDQQGKCYENWCSEEITEVLLFSGFMYEPEMVTISAWKIKMIQVLKKLLKSAACSSSWTIWGGISIVFFNNYQPSGRLNSKEAKLYCFHAVLHRNLFFLLFADSLMDHSNNRNSCLITCRNCLRVFFSIVAFCSTASACFHVQLLLLD